MNEMLYVFCFGYLFFFGGSGNCERKKEIQNFELNFKYHILKHSPNNCQTTFKEVLNPVY